MYVMLGIGASGVLFGAARFFARGEPHTMTKEFQEASNEYLKVCTPSLGKRRLKPPLRTHNTAMMKCMILTSSRTTGAEGRAHHRCLLRGLRRCRYGPEQAPGQIDALHSLDGANERNVVEYPVEGALLLPMSGKQRSHIFPCVGCSRDFGSGKVLGRKLVSYTHPSICHCTKILCRRDFGCAVYTCFKLTYYCYLLREL